MPVRLIKRLLAGEIETSRRDERDASLAAVFADLFRDSSPHVEMDSPGSRAGTSASDPIDGPFHARSPTTRAYPSLRARTASEAARASSFALVKSRPSRSSFFNLLINSAPRSFA